MSSCTASFRSETDAHRRTIMRWMLDYLCQPEPRLGRVGAVCPFVEPSLVADALRLEIVDLEGTISYTRLETVVCEAVDRFHAMVWPVQNRLLNTLVTGITGLSAGDCALLDLVQANLKTPLVQTGVMIGQFHPDCDDRSARNSAFLVSRSPVPLVAIRHMAMHDILFLDERGDWFIEYDRRFGRRYRNPGRIDPLFTERYHAAVARWRGEGPSREAP